MILKASQRASGQQLAAHLLNANHNDHITVHEVSGFISDEVHGAFKEAEAISKGTKCTQYLFSLSLSPPIGADVTSSDYEEIIARIEMDLALKNQPRVIVFHEKKDRIHAHAVWSRIDADTMTAINLPFFKRKLMEISREIYLEKDWKLPSGFLSAEQRDPNNYSLEEYSQAKRLERNPKLLKALLQTCWHSANTKNEFQTELKAHGFYLAKGDRRGYVAVNMTGEVLSLSRWTGVKSKDLKDKLGDRNTLPSVSDVAEQINETAKQRVISFEADLKTRYQTSLAPLKKKRKAMVEEQNAAREALEQTQSRRAHAERTQRQQKFRSGLKGLWDRLNGRHKMIAQQNEHELKLSNIRDQTERHTLQQTQLKERRHIARRIQQVRQDYYKKKSNLCNVMKPTSEPSNQQQRIAECSRPNPRFLLR